MVAYVRATQVSDFGFARRIGEFVQCGTCLYTAPESVK